MSLVFSLRLFLTFFFAVTAHDNIMEFYFDDFLELVPLTFTGDFLGYRLMQAIPPGPPGPRIRDALGTF